MILVSVMGCSNLSHRKTIKFLSNDSVKYWYRYHQDTQMPYSIGYCINKNGTFTRYYNPGGNRKIRSIDELPPVHSRSVWRVINDSIIMFGEDEYNKILFLNADSIILKGIKPGPDVFLKLHRDEDQSTKPN